MVIYGIEELDVTLVWEELQSDTIVNMDVNTRVQGSISSDTKMFLDGVVRQDINNTISIEPDVNKTKESCLFDVLLETPGRISGKWLGGRMDACDVFCASKSVDRRSCIKEETVFQFRVVSASRIYGGLSKHKVQIKGVIRCVVWRIRRFRVGLKLDVVHAIHLC